MQDPDTTPSCHLYKLDPRDRIKKELRALGAPLDDETQPLSVDLCL